MRLVGLYMYSECNICLFGEDEKDLFNLVKDFQNCVSSERNSQK